MRTKLTALLAICIFLCLAGLCVLAFLAGKYRNLFFVLPSEIGTRRFGVQAIEDFAEKEFLLSYEITGSEKASLSYAEHTVTVIATNSSYPHVLGFNMPEGAFFSKQAWTGKQRQAVLNEKAVLAIFGSGNIVGSSFRMLNDTWIITGVISDGDKDKAKIYIPSSVRGGEAGALALMGGDETYARNSLKTFGVGANFDFINLGTQCRLLWERAEVIVLLFFAFLFLSLLKPMIGGFRKALAAMKRDLTRFYAGELLQKRGKSVYKMVFRVLGLVLLPTLALFLLLRLASVCLPWQDIPSLANLNREFFFLQLSRLRVLELVSRFFFGFSLAFLVVFFILFNAFPVARKERR